MFRQPQIESEGTFSEQKFEPYLQVVHPPESAWICSIFLE